MTTTDPWADLFAADSALADRASTAEWVADRLRQRIIEGALSPGASLSEGGLVSALGISRNTLREAFRLLVHERLLVHKFHYGFSVRVPTVDDVVDVYRVRRLLETSVLREAAGAGADRLAAVGDAVTVGERAAAEQDWSAVGTANLRFHQAIASLAASERVDQVMRQLAAELRLVFHKVSKPRELHEPYVALNREIADLVTAGELAGAGRKLEAYFDMAEARLVEAYRQVKDA